MSAKKRWMDAFIGPIGAIILGLLMGAVLMLITGTNPITGYAALLRGSFGSGINFSETLVYVNPLIFTGLSVAVAYRAGLFNIGAEGQIIVGMLVSAFIGYKFAGLPRLLHLPLTLIGGMAGGALWAAVPGYLKAKFGVHEVVNSIMMNYVALHLSHYLVTGPLQDPNTTLPYSPDIAPSARLWRFLGHFGEQYRVNTGILIAIAAAVFVYWLLYKTTTGYEIRSVGFNPDASGYAGMDTSAAMAKAMLVSGGLAGLAGAVQVMGIQFKFLDLFGFEGWGFDGIAVALVAKNNPLGILATSFLFGTLHRGSQTMQAMAGVPKETIGIVQAIIIFVVAAEGLISGWIPGLAKIKSFFAKQKEADL
ncbi:MAG TPA: ABC transporter permease [Firmicutes bacterium]|nr:ABC transporter permease [Bacillota bacterium]